MIYQLLELATFIMLSLLVGGLFFVNMAVAPTFAALSAGRYAEVHHILDKYSDPYMPRLTFATALLALGEVWFPQPAWQLLTRIIGIACILGIAITSIVVHGPVNRRIRTWQPEKNLEHLQEMRARWISGHHFRTVLAFIGLVTLFLPAIFPA